ncbi:helix-turn-helix transcriptional regulator [Aquincola sp. S2]|uniref:Helix-turn-helix transcriptional regulator n=1 Tax=Pseudaquabacterium terrae TaxID=2732868 RepID=A0ABX2EH76_9BURK|nr:AraC family transcriptional regulator [Aquabacterium terrae]NRF67982.1 helix-turn-helix transcriptional regulator [Aquabacterium terrae]
MDHASRSPAPPLDRFVSMLWTSARPQGLAHAREWNLPTGCADLIVPLTQGALHRFAGRDDMAGHWLAGGVLQGAQQRATLRDTAGALAVVGAHFRPGGLVAFVAAPADEYTGRSIALDELWPGFAAALQDRLTKGGRLATPAARLDALEAALRERFLPEADVERWLGWAVAQLASGARVGTVQSACGLSPARFIERYRRAVGLTPKLHGALLRFNALLQDTQPDTAWAEAASDAGYSDQAHLAREFRRFAGFTPGDYRRDATAFPSHVACR